eukprot:jgi/Orpsp1_1/1185759/evm.model.c7180000095106.1
MNPLSPINQNQDQNQNQNQNQNQDQNQDQNQTQNQNQNQSTQKTLSSSPIQQQQQQQQQSFVKSNQFNNYNDSYHQSTTKATVNNNTKTNIFNGNGNTHSPLPYIPNHPLPPQPTSTKQSSKYTSSSNIIGRLIYTFYYSSSRILNVDDVVKIKKIFDNNWVKVERNPNEFFIIPLLVLDAPFEEIRMFKRRSQKHRGKANKEESRINERVEPTPEYLYHCAYISHRDFQKMTLNSRWERKIKSLNHPLPEIPNQSYSTTTSSFLHHRLDLPIYSHQHKTIPNIDLEPFMEHDSNYYNNNSTLKIHSKAMKKEIERNNLINPFSDSSLDGINMGSSQDDIIIKENSHSRNLGSSSGSGSEFGRDDHDDDEKENYYHFKNVSDPGMATTTLKSFNKKDDEDEDDDDDDDDEDNEGEGEGEENSLYSNEDSMNVNINQYKGEEENEEDDEEDIVLNTFPKPCRYSTIKSQSTLVDENYNDDGDDEAEDEDGIDLNIDLSCVNRSMEKRSLILKSISQIRKEDSESTIAVNKPMEPIFNTDFPDENHIDIKRINSNAYGHVIDGHTNLIINDRRAN